jgi:uncharacterized protein YegL
MLLFRTLFIISISAMVYATTLQESFGSTCAIEYDGLNEDLIRQYNCFQPNSLKWAGDMPNVDWDPYASKYMSSQLYRVVKAAINDLITNSNVAEFMVPGADLRFYFFRAYMSLPQSMAYSYYFASNSCSISLMSITNPVLGLFEMGTQLSVLPIHPLIDEGLSVWRQNVSYGSEILVPNAGDKGYISRTCPSYPCLNANNDLVLYKVSSTWGHQVSIALLQRMLAAYGIPYSVAARLDNKITGVEVSAYPSTFLVTKQSFKTLHTTVYSKLNISASDINIPHFILPNPLLNYTLNVQAFKHYWNYNSPQSLIANESTNILDEDTQNKLLLETPISGFGKATCDVVCDNSQLLDLMFIIDGSGSVTLPNFLSELEFAVNVSKALNVSPDTVRAGVIVFSSTVTSVYDLNAFVDVASLEATVKVIPYPAGYTYTGLALAQAREILTNASRGARVITIPKMIIIVTDGYSNMPWNTTITEANLIHAAGINVVAIGVGSAVNMTELEAFASEPTIDNIYPLANFSLGSITSKIEQSACEVPAKIVDEALDISSTIPSETVLNMQFYTSLVEYMLLIQTDGRVLIYMNYYPSEVIPTEYEHDLLYDCTTECNITVPAYELTWNSILGRDLLPNRPVFIAMKFEGSSTRTTSVSYRLARVPYNANTVSSPVITTYTPATAEEIEQASTDFEIDHPDMFPASTDEPAATSDDSINPLFFIFAAVGVATIVSASVVVVLRRKSNSGAVVIPV